ncbi:MAG: ATP-binding cassette domain-containing protein [Leptospiraceae bacterium]|nr:ATP-binding cassette domain-containing protein [Leptospiraceae bacterium]MDW8307319.1 ATP-binding cassette domain-containing protein [Leptospiraceae bacterium]
MQALVQVENLSFSYGPKQILRDVSFELHKGGFYSLIGPSGSGKSTLLYILGGFLRPQKGRYLFQGKTVYRVGEFGLGRFRKKNIGFLFQDFRLLPFLTVEQNILFPVLFTGKRVGQRDLESLLDSLGLTHRRKAYPRDISGGEAQRCALGRALILKPKLLLLDEPTGNLDEKTEKEILELLLTLKSDKLTLFCVTHSRQIMQASHEIFEILDHSLVRHKTKLKKRNT